MEPMICAASGQTIPEGAAYITDADGNHYLPEHYPEPAAEPEQLDLGGDDAPAKKSARK